MLPERRERETRKVQERGGGNFSARECARERTGRKKRREVQEEVREREREKDT